MKQIAIVGVGFMGGCLASAIKYFDLCDRLLGVESNKENSEYILRSGLVDELVSVIPRNTDIVLIAVPNQDIAHWVCRLAEHPAVVVDIGSVKVEILGQVESILGKLPENYVPCHPIAGAEKTGPEEAFPTLFDKRSIAVIRHENVLADAFELVLGFWSKLGAITVPLTAEVHDRVLAKTSHLPHVLAYAYMSLIEEADINLAAGGLEDFTRIAGSNPDMWWEIFQLNRGDLLKSIRDFSRVLDKFDKAISEGDRDLVIDIMMSSATKRKNLN